MFDRVRKLLAGHQRRELPLNGLTPAAVLVPLFLKGGEPHLLMGLRTDRVLHHKRQISFPGGVRDPRDKDLVETALREAWEEVGIRRDDVVVLGMLSDIETITGYRVTPVVGIIPFPYEFRLNDVEVERLLLVPWAVFAEPREHRRTIVERDGKPFEVDFYGYKEHTIWGATARITRQLVELVGDAGRASMEES